MCKVVVRQTDDGGQELTVSFISTIPPPMPPPQTPEEEQKKDDKNDTVDKAGKSEQKGSDCSSGEGSSLEQ